MSSEESNDEEEYYPPVTRGKEKPTARKSTNSQAQVNSGYATRRKTARQKLKDLKANQSKSDRFLSNFNPESSTREKRKVTRKMNPPSNIRRPAGAVYDENGIHLTTGLDLCDCLNEDCLGCFLPCSKCNSEKCGTDCRNHRKYIIEQIEYHGFDHIIKNPLLKN